MSASSKISSSVSLGAVEGGTLSLTEFSSTLFCPPEKNNPHSKNSISFYVYTSYLRQLFHQYLQEKDLLQSPFQLQLKPINSKYILFL